MIENKDQNKDDNKNKKKIPYPGPPKVNYLGTLTQDYVEKKHNPDGCSGKIIVKRKSD